MVTMHREYNVKRKLQEQSGSYFVFLPKLWVDSYDLKQGDTRAFEEVAVDAVPEGF